MATPPDRRPEVPAAPEPYHEPRAAADDSPRPAEPVVEVHTAVADPALLSESEAAAAKRAETASAVALVAAIAASRAEAAAEAAASVQPVVEVAKKKPGKIKALRAVVAMLIRAALVIALFVGGYVLGQTAFRNNQSEAPTSIVDPTTAGAQPPAVVREFVGALSSGDADALRSSLQAEPHARLTSEFRRFGIQSINGVETLSTHVDGVARRPRSSCRARRRRASPSRSTSWSWLTGTRSKASARATRREEVPTMTKVRQFGSNLAFIWNKNLFRLLIVLALLTLRGQRALGTSGVVDVSSA